MSNLPENDQFDTALLLTLREEFQSVKAQTARYEDRLAELENIIKDLAKDIKKLVVLRTVEAKDEIPDRDVGKQISDTELSEEKSKVDVEEMNGNWSYVVAKKGGYNNILHIAVQDLFELEEDPIQFLTFLVQKRDYEIKERLQQLQAEYQKLQGSQLQEHFRELWKSHYTLLKSKQKRTWKEEIFLEAFDAFIAWLQT